MKRRSGIWGNNTCREAEGRAGFPERGEPETKVSQYGDKNIRYPKYQIEEIFLSQKRRSFYWVCHKNCHVVTKDRVSGRLYDIFTWLFFSRARDAIEHDWLLMLAPNQTDNIHIYIYIWRTSCSHIWLHIWFGINQWCASIDLISGETRASTKWVTHLSFLYQTTTSEGNWVTKIK